MSDADSESEYSDHSKIPIFEKSLLPTKYPDGIVRKRRSKNKFKDAHKRKKCIWISALVLVIIMLIILFTTPSSQNKRKSILVLNWNSDIANGAALRNNCEIVITNDITSQILLDGYNNYDAIVINSTAENILLGIDTITNYRNNQITIFATRKPLQYSNSIQPKAYYMRSDVKTLSYSLKSDFLWQSYKIVRLNDSTMVAPSLQPQWDVSNKSFKSDQTRKFFLHEVKKPSPLALTVLQRPCQKARQELLKHIMENLDVHTYGVCGNYTCDDDCLNLPISHGNDRYKFYFAFEEELCVDYVGENFFKALRSRLVPVVFGGANYTNFAPPNSYINARDFASIRELTDHLLFLDQNPEEHIKYFTWHDTYKIERTGFDFNEICDYLVAKDSGKMNTNTNLQTDENIVDWLKENKCQTYELPNTWRS